jgi:hypothetical protein
MVIIKKDSDFGAAGQKLYLFFLEMSNFKKFLQYKYFLIFFLKIYKIIVIFVKKKSLGRMTLLNSTLSICVFCFIF